MENNIENNKEYIAETDYPLLIDNMLNGYAYCKMIFNILGQPTDWIYIKVNKRFEELVGIKNIEGKKATNAIPGIKESNQDLFDLYGKAAKNGASGKIETYVAPLKRWFSISVYSPRKGYFAAVFDVITERKEKEAQLREELALNKLITESSPFGILVYNATTGQCIFANDSSVKEVGASKEQLLKQNFREIKSWKANGSKMLQTAEKVISTCKNQTIEEHGINTFGKEVYISVIFLCFSKENETFLMLMIKDITDLKKIEGQTKEHLAELEKISHLMVGRELTMNEQKAKIKELEEKITKLEADKK